MKIPRLIPCLLASDAGLVKTRRFQQPSYVGDPLNTIRIFSQWEAHEIILLSIDRGQRGPDFELVRSVSAECFVPLCYGGGITKLDEIRRLVAIGLEKVSLNSALWKAPMLLREASQEFGSQAVVASLDVTTRSSRYQVLHRDATPLEKLLDQLQADGVGEVLLTAVNREGTGSGYDLDLIRWVSRRLSVPLIAQGGASSLEDVQAALEAGAAAAAAGRLFVYYQEGAVLPNYPDKREVARIESALARQ